jgi:D-cysteine desulfhydrase family pyridoxal phosphate-dependent enzyme
VIRGLARGIVSHVRYHARMPLDRIPLTTLPTPLEEAPRLSAELGIRLLIKRDDLTGLGLGGNKVRKLEFLLADAVAKGAHTLVTGGGGQSNFCRMTAAAAARAGMKCHLVLGGDDRPRHTGNLLLDDLFGATLHFTGTDDWQVWQSEIKRIAAEIGDGAYAMPIGGSTPVGAMGYVHLAAELLGQMESPPDWVVHATASGGTQAGLVAGLPARVRVLGIGAARPDPPLAQTVARIAEKAAALAGREAPLGEVTIEDHTGPAYASITDECRDAVRLAARTEALVLDPVYTGKAMAGLIAAAREKRIGGTVVFIHTGGAPALFADEFRPFFDA